MKLSENETKWNVKYLAILTEIVCSKRQIKINRKLNTVTMKQ